MNIKRFRHPIDKVWNIGYKMPKLNALISYPFIAVQDIGWSDILKKSKSTKGTVDSSHKLLKKYIEKERSNKN